MFLVQLLLLAAIGAGQQEKQDQCQAEDCAETLLVQLSLSTQPREPPAASKERDLVFTHVPYNFGHTIEQVAFAGSGNMGVYASAQIIVDGSPLPVETKFDMLQASMQPQGEIWGHMNPALHGISNVTGCPLYYTPPKHWPKDLADWYFAGKQTFGVLRDPYERLVAQFRGNIPGYGGAFPNHDACDVDAAVRKMLQRYMAGDVYAEDCTYVPQAEYFDPPHGITVPVDNRIFPTSANDVLAEHGYTNMNIATGDIMHVSGCPEVWPGDLSCDTKKLIREVYARDFELLCKHFGYCDAGENVCLTEVPEMCPSNMSQKIASATYCA